MIKLIIKAFIKDYQNFTDTSVRESYGVLAGVLGIICNLLLFAVKLAIGLSINSIGVISDAFNNLTDSGSSVVSIIGVKLSNRPPDREHPYGHGRLEYIASLVISFIILSVGLQLLITSSNKVLSPEVVLFNPVLLVLLSLSVLVKAWMYSYNSYISKAINSSINRAVAFDSLNDTILTSAVIVTTAASHFVALPLDGLAGIAVSLFILYTGFSTARDTVDLLIGSPPDDGLVDAINSMVAGGRYVLRTHDLKVHEYGPGRIVASIHAEVPDNASLLEVHTSIDGLEKRVADELGVSIVIHMDPVPAVPKH